VLRAATRRNIAYLGQPSVRSFGHRIQGSSLGDDRYRALERVVGRIGMAEVPSGSRELGDVQRARVEALGEPGQRRFRLLAVINGETFIAWMEKQQLDALGRALEQVLDQLPERGPDLLPLYDPIDFDFETRRQFRVGRMELGFDEEHDRLVVIAHDIEADLDEDSGFTCRLTRSQARDLSNDAAAVVAAGRPRCVLCGQPMGSGPHACPQQNGHLPDELGGSAADEESED
jgi:uncharacterized repeat protein (TIGR03847 family)